MLKLLYLLKQRRRRERERKTNSVLWGSQVWSQSFFFLRCFLLNFCLLTFSNFRFHWIVGPEQAQLFVFQLFFAAYKAGRHWIGVKVVAKSTRQSDATFIDGTPFTPNSLFDLYLDGSNTECVHLYYYKETLFQSVYSQFCPNLYPYICQFDPGNPTVDPGHVDLARREPAQDTGASSYK